MMLGTVQSTSGLYVYQNMLEFPTNPKIKERKFPKKKNEEEEKVTCMICWWCLCSTYWCLKQHPRTLLPTYTHSQQRTHYFVSQDAKKHPVNK